ncbi:MAG: hypothetical protein MJ142_07780, partial [Clostridia bacterium]|nr:hypothetical protein [Clostridia bacterium]
MKNSARKSMLRTVFAFICAAMLLAACLPAGATTAPTQNPDITYGDLLDMGLAEITQYGVVADVYHQSGHAEISAAVTTLDKQSSDPFMPTKDTLNDQGELIITPTVTVSGAHSAFTTKFALFRKDGTGYTRVTDPVTAQFTAQSGSETLTLPPFSITDQTVKMAGVYLMEVDASGDYVLNGEIGDQNYTVQYGDEAGVDPLPIQSTQLISYIGKIDGKLQDVDIKLMQGTAFDGQRVDFGPNIHLYEKTGSSYTQVDGSTTHAVSQMYLRDDTWPEGVYKQFLNVTYDGSGKFNYGGYDIQFGFDKGSPEGTDQDYAAYLLDKATALSQLMAGPDVTGATSDGKPGGRLKNGVEVVSKNANDEYWGNGTVASWEELGGKFGNTTLTFYSVDVKNGSINLKDLDPTPNSEIQNKGLPISDNEYIVINVICPSKTGTINGSQEPLKLKDENGNTINPGQWRAGGASAFSRVIWNYVYLADDGTYQPYEGTIVHQRTSPGLNFAPKAKVEVRDVGDAVSYVVKEVENFGVELHQTLHEPISRTVKALLYKGGIVVLKKDSNGDAVEGAVFTVYSDEDCAQAVDTFSPTAIGADSNYPALAASILNRTEPGTYYVKETSVPEGYIMDDTVYTVTVTSGEGLTYVNGGNAIVNEVEGARGYIDIVKADSANSSKKLSGATFGIFRDAGCTQKAGDLGPTDENGYALSKALPEGTYYIKEIVAPAGYKLNESNTYTVTVTGDTTSRVNGGNPVLNTKAYGYIDVRKVDADNTSKMLSGAVFTVYSDAQCSEESAVLGPTDSNGYAKLQTSIPVGQYWVKETTTPQGYAPDGTVHTVTVTDGGCATVNTSVVTNKAGHGRICLYKAAAEDDTKMLENAQYYIYTDPECKTRLSLPDNKNAYVMHASDENGYAFSSEIPFGTYYVKEFRAPNHYTTSAEIFKVEVNNEGTATQVIGPGSVNAAILDEWNETPEGQIKVYKADADSPSTHLGGAVFGVYSDPDCTQLVTSMTTANGTGYAKTGYIPYGTYYVQEITPPDGYDPDFTIYEVGVYDSSTTSQVIGTGPSSSEHQVLNKKSKGQGRIRVIKADAADTTKMLAGAKFKIYSNSACTDDYYVTTLVTDDNGEALSDYLPIGDYWVKEVEAPEGYSIDRTSAKQFTLALSASGKPQVYKYTWNDTKGATVRIYAVKNLTGKTDTTSRFSFELSAKSGSNPMPAADQRTITVADGESAPFGRIDFKPSDLAGYDSRLYQYTVKEIIPSDGDKVPHVLYDEKEYTVTIELRRDGDELVAECIDYYENGSPTGSESNPIIITNTYDGGFIKVTKSDSANSSVTLEGASFKVYDNQLCDGEPVASMTTGNDGTAMTEEALPAGEYWVVETIGPRGYAIDNPDPVKVVVTKDHTAEAPCTVAFTDTELKAKAAFKVQKTLGEDLTTDEKFTFKLTAKTEGAPMPKNTTVEVAGGETGVFDEIDFKGTDLGADISKVFEYEITEIVPENPGRGIVYDTTVKTVSVTLRIVSNKLRAIPSTDTEVPEFVNDYGEGYIEVVKTDADDEDKYLKDAEFEIYDNASCTGDPVATLTTGTDGTAISEALPTGDYWVVETAAPTGYAIDSAEPVKVTVTKDHTADAPISVAFTDSMTASTEVFAKKKVTGKNDSTTMFTFSLAAVTTGAPMPDVTTVSAKNGETKSFGEITYTHADLGVDTTRYFEYTVKEVIPTEVPKGWTYDTNTYNVKVKLEYSNGTLTATLVSPETGKPLGTETDPVIITNTYAAKGEITLTGTKTMDGRDLTDDDVFTFTVKDENNTTVATGASDKDGVITFTKIEYSGLDSVGNYTYTITEDDTGIDGVTKDSSKLTVKVSVTDNGDGTLKAEIVTTDSDDIEFTNTYGAAGGITLTGAKELEGRDLTTNDKFTFT